VVHSLAVILRLLRILLLLPPMLLPLALGACASAKVRSGGRVDLSAARQAVEAARKAGAPARAADTFKQAERHLKQAESLAASADLTPEKSLRAQGLGELATAEAHCSATLARLSTPGTERTARASSPEVERANTRSRKLEDDVKRLEERIALLLHDLEVTETEVIRTKARLKGIETKAEASSAIAEARILMGRLDAKSNAATLSLCEDSLAKAEKQLQQENYGAALFFAMKAQDAATKAGESPERRASPTPPPD
jgi:predicted  nucleic acid-binding Zn-ribbon protein